jgi:hypothetical protein
MTSFQKVRPVHKNSGGTYDVISASSPLPITEIASNTSLYNGSVTVSPVFTMKQLSATSVPINSVLIQAKSTNTGVISVGSSPVYATPPSLNGFELESGDILPLKVSNLNKIWIDSSVVSEGINYVATK